MEPIKRLPIKILVVDDQRLTRMSLKATIETNKEELLLVGEAEEGREAIELTAKLKPDIILMDIGMPILDGVRATQEIRKKHPDIKIIMLTTHESEADILDSFRSGANSYCLKDTSPEALIQALISTANGACWIDPKIARVVISNSITPIANDSNPTAEAPEPSTFSLLTPREIDVLKLIAEGKNNTEITETLCLSKNTIKTHIKNIFQKLEVEDRTAAALKAIRERII